MLPLVVLCAIDSLVRVLGGHDALQVGFKVNVSVLAFCHPPHGLLGGVETHPLEQLLVEFHFRSGKELVF